MASRTTAASRPLRILDEIRADLGEASAVVPLRHRRFLVADDEGGLRLVDASDPDDVAVTILFDAGDDDRVAGLEGLCVIDGRAYAIREADGAVVSCALPATQTPKAKAKAKTQPALEEHGHLPRPDDARKKNKGFEGLALLPARVAFDGADHLIAVHEDKPRSVSVFSWPGLALEAHHSIDDHSELEALLPDLSDVAVHPETGELWLLSDESETIAVVSLDADGLHLVRSHAVPVKDGEKPEGLAFDDDSALWLVTDDSGRLLRLSL